MQLRDQAPDIAYSGCWGLFGGQAKGDEDPVETLRRELLEELNFNPGQLTFFTSIYYDLTPRGQERKFRAYFETPLSEDEYKGLTLNEGTGMALLPISEIISKKRVISFDEYALRLFTGTVVGAG